MEGTGELEVEREREDGGYLVAGWRWVTAE